MKGKSKSPPQVVSCGGGWERGSLFSRMNDIAGLEVKKAIDKSV
jgi:hypothetical protein